MGVKDFLIDIIVMEKKATSKYQLTLYFRLQCVLPTRSVFIKKLMPKETRFPVKLVLTELYTIRSKRKARHWVFQYVFEDILIHLIRTMYQTVSYAI